MTYPPEIELAISAEDVEMAIPFSESDGIISTYLKNRFPNQTVMTVDGLVYLGSKEGFLESVYKMSPTLDRFVSLFDEGQIKLTVGRIFHKLYRLYY